MLTARQCQLLLAAVFLGLGTFCLAAPAVVLELAIRPQYRSNSELERLLMGCFGAQACLAGLFAATSRFTRTTFLAYGLALLPFFWFNWFFYVRRPMLTEFGLLDGLFNVFMLALCVVGYRRGRR